MAEWLGRKFAVAASVLFSEAGLVSAKAGYSTEIQHEICHV
jgi:hypothetical protein